MLTKSSTEETNFQISFAQVPNVSDKGAGNTKGVSSSVRFCKLLTSRGIDSKESIPRRFQGMNSASLCSLAGRYDDPIPTRFLASKECLKMTARNAPVQVVGDVAQGAGDG
jgi:hypothetical protein